MWKCLVGSLFKNLSTVSQPEPLVVFFARGSTRVIWRVNLTGVNGEEKPRCKFFYPRSIQHVRSREGA